MNQLAELVKSTKGRFFSVTFERKDGTVRTINAKDKFFRLLAKQEDTLVERHPNGLREAGYVPVVNRNTETWAAIHDSRVIRFKCGADEKTFA